MNNSFSLQQISKTGNLDSNLISCQNKLNLMNKIMQIKVEIPKTKQSETTDQLGYSSSTLKRYRNDMLWFYRMKYSKITIINAQKRLQIQLLTKIHIVNTNTNELK